MRTNRHFAFTLIELLAVMAIIGLVAVIGVPAFYRLSKSAGLSTGAQQLTATLSLARQYAITRRERTFVVFPFSQTTGADWTNRRYQVYSVIASNRTTGLYYAGKWQALPNGVAIVDLNPLGTGGNRYNPDSYLKTDDFTVDGTTNKTFAYIEFRPTGSTGPCEGANLFHRITLVEGHYVSPKVTRISSNYVDVIVEPMTGRIRTERPQ